MSNATSARQFGDDYQALVFWKYATMMLSGALQIEKIIYENDKIKSFDDIVLHYSKPQRFRSTNIMNDYIQVKFHMSKTDMFTVDNLINPKFINADTYSILDNILRAYKELGKDEFERCRFVIYSNWDIDQKDVLYKLISNVDSSFNLKALTNGKTSKSKMGAVRSKLCKHLNIDEETLLTLLKQVRLLTGKESYCDILSQINIELRNNRLKIIEGNSDRSEYISLIREWNKREIREFDDKQLRELLESNNMFISDTNETRIGVKSFKKNTKGMQKRAYRMLDLTDYFDGRFLVNGTWENIYCKLDEFVDNLPSEKQYIVELQTHSSIAFALGNIMNSVSGIDATPIQKTMSGSKEWSHKQNVNTGYNGLIEKIDSYHRGEDTVIALSISNDIYADVRSFIKNNMLSIDLAFFLNMPEPGVDAVLNDDHAWALVAQIDSIIRKRMSEIKKGTIHIFSSCPNAIMFNWGKMTRLYGNIQMYEYDKVGQNYYPTIKIL